MTTNTKKTQKALRMAMERAEALAKEAGEAGNGYLVAQAVEIITAIREALALTGSACIEQPAPKWMGARFDSALHEQPAQVAEPRKQQEPVAWIYKPNMELLWPDEIEVKDPSKSKGYKPLYTSPQPGKPLTDEFISSLHYGCSTAMKFARAIEAAHGIHAAPQLKGDA